MRHEGRKNLANTDNVPAYGTFPYTRVTRLPAFTGDNIKVTEVSQSSYSVYFWPQSAPVQAHRRVVNHGLELGKQPLFRIAEGFGLPVTGPASVCRGLLLPRLWVITRAAGSGPGP